MARGQHRSPETFRIGALAGVQERLTGKRIFSGECERTVGKEISGSKYVGLNRGEQGFQLSGQ